MVLDIELSKHKSLQTDTSERNNYYTVILWGEKKQEENDFLFFPCYILKYMQKHLGG